LNSAPLEPLSTNTSELDNLVNAIFAKIHTSGMTTYDKVKACYDYLVNNCTYNTPFYIGNSSSMIYSSYYDETMVRNAHYILSTGQGVCDNYSAAFAVMCRRIGLNAHVMGGTVSKKGGGRTGHAWSYIILDGTEYIFDPQVQSNNKNISYYYFGKTYAQMGSTYQKDADWYSSSDFAKFQCYERPQMNMQLTLEISGYEAQPFTSTHQQEGMSATLDLSGGIPIVMKENSTVDITVTPSGGSGQYILGVLVINGDTGEETVAYQKEINGSDSFTLNCNTYSTISNPCFAVVLFDALNESSYVVQEGIKFITSAEN
ncbi:MAG: transglutaminase domain-containing protein, partial [Acutalibacteraceae bacterium]